METMTLEALRECFDVSDCNAGESVPFAVEDIAMWHDAADAAIRERDELRSALAALRKRIEGAPQTTFELRQMGTPFAGINVAYSIPGWIGKRVRLLVEDDDEP